MVATLIIVSLYMMCLPSPLFFLPSLVAFKIFSLCLVFINLSMTCLDVILFMFILVWIGCEKSESVNCSVVSDYSKSYGLYPARLLCPQNCQGKNPAVGKPFPSPGYLPDCGIKPRTPALQADFLMSEPPRKPNLKARLTRNVNSGPSHTR